ncbi:PhoH family protein [Catenisphaera adipataccumulans]|uniref:PhoH-like protein n=1 Tax=Catenisphaera adipataccumulans TaxID=700500 RepID=A0A7W8D0G1_9FIRM|nr:phosphate starvation-inducible PhoH-like protein [Catenisphaera adipataccumulans]
MAYRTIDISQHSIEEIQIFAGAQDANLDVFEKHFKTRFSMRSSTLRFEETAEADLIEQVVDVCFQIVDTYYKLSGQDIAYIIQLGRKGQLSKFKVHQLIPVGKTRSGKMIYPKTLGQAELCDAFRSNDIVFATGVAGTGKTYLAVCYAVDLLRQEKIEKIILTRPAVEAGESLGFLPGDLKEKVDPYLRPLYDALYEMLGTETVERMIEKQIIEIAPLAFMRGRTLSHAAVILDEAQNTTRAQMKMFLTRMGDHTQMIINGDVTQIDLIRKQDSGLIEACRILKGIEGIGMVQLQAGDVVRHPLVQKIIERYAEIEKESSN